MAKVTSLQEQQREFTRYRLVDSAFELFRTKGYIATTAEDIASAVGCSRATFYLHFKSKSAVLIEYLSRVWPSVDDAMNEFATAVAEGMTKEDLRRRLGDQLREWHSVAGAPTALSVARMTDPDIRLWFNSRSARSAELVADALSTARGEPPEGHLARITLLGEMSFAAMTLEEGERKFSDNDVVDYLTDLWATLLIT
ncbi:TetR/AcrR family transcriptional regulator [Rhodococcus sp. NBC_00297]|uniref:TetR/AcrR family transcriptional regulator n=1 Tax=Rhodococcus sp. NBC_00297 TaxID=2976005 RepID=UPI002E282500|nr:TetR/AcrR family transcriptional regulator [Rhodococcus sp. NBC_00297]